MRIDRWLGFLLAVWLLPKAGWRVVGRLVAGWVIYLALRYVCEAIEDFGVLVTECVREHQLYLLVAGRCVVEGVHERWGA